MEYSKWLNKILVKECRSNPVVKLNKDDDDIARALRAMGEGGESEGSSTQINEYCYQLI